jgi:serine protease AprX
MEAIVQRQISSTRVRRTLWALRSSLLLVVLLGFGAQPLAQLPPPPDTSPVPEPLATDQLASLTQLLRFDKLDPLLHQDVWAFDGRTRVIVRAVDAGSVGAVGHLIQLFGGTLGRQLSILDAQVAEVPNFALLALAGSSLVERIARDRTVFGTMERTGAVIGSTLATQQFGYDGSGITVAIIDSGVTSWHDDLTDGGGAQRVDQYINFIDDYSAPSDAHGHGTHVAGIVGGNGFDSSGARAGIAPAARLMVLKVLDASGRGRISDVIAALDYIVTHQQVTPVRVINLSVASGVHESYNSDFLTLAAKRAVDAGIVVVAAAGNNGWWNGHTQHGLITAPGNAPWVLTVGASSHNGTVDRTDDEVARFSSRGPTRFDFATKPDLVAPGVGIESLSDPNSVLYASRPLALLDGTVATSYRPYLALSGTSQAASVVSGTVALMLQAAPNLTPNLVKAILQYTAQRYAGYDSLTEGAGFLNAYGAIELARFFAAPSASSYPPRPEWSQQIIWGNHRMGGGRLTAGSNAWSPGVVWGQDTVGGNPITWGVIQSSLPTSEGGWTSWGTTCFDLNCDRAVWDLTAENVVWGLTCGGADCPGFGVWVSAMVWASSDEDTVVWGTDDGGDTVVWGTTGDDSDTVVWGTTCEDTLC